MDQWKYIYNEEEETFSKVEHQIGDLNSGDVLIQPLRVGICGSDIKQLIHKLPNKVIGHEWVGKIISTANDVNDFKKDEIIVSVAHIRCGKCQTCLSDKTQTCLQPQLLGEGENNVLSSHIKLHSSDLLKVPQGLSLDDICLFEVAFIGDSAFERAKLIGLQPSDKCLVLGAGPIGLFTALALKTRGYNVKIVDRLPVREKVAKEANLEVIPYAFFLMDNSHHSKYECVFDCTGDNHGPGALKMAPTLVKSKHKLVIVGKYQNAQLSEDHYARKAIKLTWVSHHEKEIFEKTITHWSPLIKQYTPLFSHSYSIQNINEAFNDAINGRFVKCILKVNEQ